MGNYAILTFAIHLPAQENSIKERLRNGKRESMAPMAPLGRSVIADSLWCCQHSMKSQGFASTITTLKVSHPKP